MVDLTNEQIAAANERGRIVRETQPHARSARYDAKADQVVVELTNGATFAFPPRLAEGLHDASPGDIAEVEVIGAGFGLHWETLDLDYTVPGLVNGVFGTAKWMAARAGRTTPEGGGAGEWAQGGTAMQGNSLTCMGYRRLPWRLTTRGNPPFGRRLHRAQTCA